jgi:hypothetical protein
MAAFASPSPGPGVGLQSAPMGVSPMIHQSIADLSGPCRLHAARDSRWPVSSSDMSPHRRWPAAARLPRPLRFARHPSLTGGRRDGRSRARARALPSPRPARLGAQAERRRGGGTGAAAASLAARARALARPALARVLRRAPLADGPQRWALARPPPLRRRGWRRRTALCHSGGSSGRGIPGRHRRDCRHRAYRPTRTAALGGSVATALCWLPTCACGVCDAFG